ncbi:MULTISPECIES: DUF72 domain-containing protein [unclassified Pseudomonas]|jgi:uncharacterized protein YecE (DUF72 family)|uniref:DUF72 domain-containing protein n=1 Tax=unclassified Pseudomonas TaxID=196821 RepID=UPI000A09F59D|nr:MULTISPECIES: DUF72 domain-containing protein [unclassified Pseudomonas]MCX2687152.1 DUF72 domain-containing protein [Pseudomonas sp. DCB_AW]SMF11480.1 Uncharacterized conserved protein YecE, DUF72 family [Pseudomonas sp. LAIL14HWK12:I11]SMR75085.1 Uncharacterized conserved protein YecE, DUF72 family [Pseudomonas sp. LAIL14HWK12:I10]SOD02152.1 Uncharacterized conserved protein YecE, DUF72 family [Pseudomonas sp. LAIL14HWK12:I8]
MTPSLLPYFLGCPSWSESAWRDYLYPADARATEYLGLYSQVFNAVEGNTTFYASPAPATVARWAQVMPAHFRFTAKFPREVSHAADLREQLDAATTFTRLMAPLGERVSPYWLQLPAMFGPARLAELSHFLDEVAVPVAVEVRNDAFFARGEEERQLNRLLLERGVERICLDPRALFSCTSRDPAVLHAQAKKPKVPPRPAAFSQHPQVRFIGHPQLDANETFLTPWVDKIASWIEEGRSPYIFLHTSDNRLAAALAQRFHQRLMQRLPGLASLPELPRAPEVEQLGLL